MEYYFATSQLTPVYTSCCFRFRVFVVKFFETLSHNDTKKHEVPHMVIIKKSNCNLI
jgi:hypothetical protein